MKLFLILILLNLSITILKVYIYKVYKYKVVDDNYKNIKNPVICNKVKFIRL